MPKTACLLSHRGVLRIGGKDCRNFLQGLISNDIGLCSAEKPIYTALLTPQGKFLHDMFIHERGDSFLIDCESERADDLLQRLTAYKLRAQVTIEKASDDYEVWALLDIPLPSLREGLGVGQQDVSHLSYSWKHREGKQTPCPSPALSGKDLSSPSFARCFRSEPASGRSVFVSDPRLPALGSRGIFEKGKAPESYQVVDAALYNHHRLSLGIPDGSRDMIVGKSTLSDGNVDLLNGVSWTKGCYVGQELTARMHHRALVKKRMFQVRIEGTAPAFGSIIYFKDTEIGDMRSSQGDIGLALLNIEQAKQAMSENTALTCENTMFWPYTPEWMGV